VRQLDVMVTEGFLRPANRELVRLSPTPEAALEHLAATEPRLVEKWITPEER